MSDRVDNRRPFLRPFAWAERRESTLSTINAPYYDSYPDPYDTYDYEEDPYGLFERNPGSDPPTTRRQEDWDEPRLKHSLLKFIKSTTAVEFPSIAVIVERYVPPGICIPSIGSISVPLTDSDIGKLAAGGKQISSSKGATNIVESTIHGVLEFKHVEFRNPLWSKFVDDLALEASRELGVDRHVRAEFSKLQVYGENTLREAPYGTDGSPQMFATLVICLPTKHSGGDIELQHDGKSIRYHRDKTSEFSMSYVAWSLGFDHKVHSITSGHQVILIYDLVHKFDAPLSYEPNIVPLDRLDKKIAAYRRLLEKWHDLDTPFLIYALGEPYFNMDLSLSILHGEDATRAKFLDLVHFIQHEDSITTKFVPLLARMTLFEHLQNDGVENELDEVVYLQQIYDLDGTRIPLLGQHRDLLVDPDCVINVNHWLKRTPDAQTGGEYGSDEGINKEYYDAVIILVKESSLIQFLTGHNVSIDKWDSEVSQDMDYWIETLAKRCESEVKAKSDSTRRLLSQVYDWLVKQNNDGALGAAAVCAVYLADAARFQRVASKLKLHFRPRVYEFLGTLIDVDDPIVDLGDLLETFTRTNSVAKTRLYLKDFTTASERIRSTIQLQTLTRSAIFTTLKSSRNITDADKKAFVEIIHELEGSKILWKSAMFHGLKSFLARHSDNEDFVIGFILSSQTNRSPVETALLRSIMPAARSVFYLPNLFHWQDRSIKLGSLRRFLNLINELAPEELPGYLQIILQQARLLQQYEFMHVLRMAMHFPLCPPDFCQKLAESYLIHKVRPEPQRLEDWARSENEPFVCPCKNNTCADCHAVRSFVLGPERKSPWYCFGRYDSDRHWKEFIDWETKDDTGRTVIRKTKRLRYDHDAWRSDLRTFRSEMYHFNEDALEAKLGPRMDGILAGRIVRATEQLFEDEAYSDDDDWDEESDEERSDEDLSDEEEPRQSRRPRHPNIEWNQTILPFLPIRKSRPGGSS